MISVGPFERRVMHPASEVAYLPLKKPSLDPITIGQYQTFLPGVGWWGERPLIGGVPQGSILSSFFFTPSLCTNLLNLLA